MGKLKINGELDLNSYLTAVSDLYLSSADGTSIIFRNGTTEAGRITSDGYLQLGGTSTGSYRLYVNGMSYLSGTNYLYGTTYARYLYPSSNGSYSLGTSSYVWGSAYIRNLYIYDSTNNKSVGSFYASTLGTTSASGISRLVIGNSYSLGMAGNAYGVLRIYSTSSTYGDLRSSGGGVTHYLPSIGGTLLNTGNYNSYVPKKDGTGATGTWAIDISGNASTATKLATARTISLTGSVTGSGSFDGSGNLSISTHSGSFMKVTGPVSSPNIVYDTVASMIQGASGSPSGSQYGAFLTLPYRKTFDNTQPDFAGQIFIPNGDDSTTPDGLYYRTSMSTSWRNWKSVIHSCSATYFGRTLPSSGMNTGDVFFKT